MFGRSCTYATCRNPGFSTGTDTKPNFTKGTFYIRYCKIRTMPTQSDRRTVAGSVERGMDYAPVRLARGKMLEKFNRQHSIKNYNPAEVNGETRKTQPAPPLTHDTPPLLSQRKTAGTRSVVLVTGSRQSSKTIPYPGSSFGMIFGVIRVSYKPSGAELR